MSQTPGQHRALRPLQGLVRGGLATRATVEDACGAAVHLSEAAAIGLPVARPVPSFPFAAAQPAVCTAHA